MSASDACNKHFMARCIADKGAYAHGPWAVLRQPVWFLLGPPARLTFKGSRRTGTWGSRFQRLAGRFIASVKTQRRRIPWQRRLKVIDLVAAPFVSPACVPKNKLPLDHNTGTVRCTRSPDRKSRQGQRIPLTR